jgi:hypothetical protein
MAFGRVNARDAGPRFFEDDVSGAAELEALAMLDEDEDEDEAFGPLAALSGWVGTAGPGVALRFPLRTALDPGIAGIELRLRENGRYVRGVRSRWRDRHGDLTLTLPLPPGRDERIVVAHLPYAALPRRIGPDVVIEAWLVEDGEPVEEALWPIELPGWTDRLLENALGTVAFVAVSSAALERSPTAGDTGALAATRRQARIEAALARLFHLDPVGRDVASEIVRGVEPGGVGEAVNQLRSHVAVESLPRILAFLLDLGGPSAPERRFLDAIVGRLGVAASHDEPPRRARRHGSATHLAVLDLAEGATWDEIRAAYRRAASEHHPDRAQALPPDQQQAAHERMKRINAAYAALRRSMGAGG